MAFESLPVAVKAAVVRSPVRRKLFSKAVTALAVGAAGMYIGNKLFGGDPKKVRERLLKFQDLYLNLAHENMLIMERKSGSIESIQKLALQCKDEFGHVEADATGEIEGLKATISRAAMKQKLHIERVIGQG